MKKISILYPGRKEATFDFTYYTEKHMTRTLELFSAHSGFRGVSVEKGIAGAIPGSEAPYTAMCHFLFDSVESFMEAFLPHAEELQNDIKVYTNIEPLIQISEVLITQ